MPRDGLEHGLPARGGQDGACRVGVSRLQVHQPRAGPGQRVFQHIRLDAVAVAGHGHQGEPRCTGDSDRADIGRRLEDDRVARSAQVPEHGRERCLPARGDQHILAGHGSGGLGREMRAQLGKALRRQPAPRLWPSHGPGSRGSEQSERLQPLVEEPAAQRQRIGRCWLYQAFQVSAQTGPGAKRERLPRDIGRCHGRAARRRVGTASRTRHEQAAHGQIG